ncbi:fmrfamide receptor-related [Anaeramoeba flamelloides]|uniref:Fmrfamide receptor-related n=1 Tax=Anaeramoeba flamelloides TaxID=1746091 RepID=A0ABQ8XY94_9EUKA|nr:fmrfamide receptor-related [Anaeramoeba flamelloides]
METPTVFEETFPKLPKLELIRSKWGELKKFPDRVRMLLKVLPESIRGMEERHLDSAFIKKLQNEKGIKGAPESIEFHRSCITLLSFLTNRQKRSIERGLASFIKRTYNLHNVKPHSRGWIIYGQKHLIGMEPNNSNKNINSKKTTNPNKPIISNKTNNTNNSNNTNKTSNSNNSNKTNNTNNTNKTNNTNNTNKTNKTNKTKEKSESYEISWKKNMNNISKINNPHNQNHPFQNIRKRKTRFVEKEGNTIPKNQQTINNTKKKKKTNKQTKNNQTNNSPNTEIHKKSDLENTPLPSDKQQPIRKSCLVPQEPESSSNDFQQKATILIELCPKMETKEESWLWEFEQRFPSVWN